jgi:hypothetical protein
MAETNNGSDLTIEEEIVKWAHGRSQWQQNVLCKLASGHTYTDDEIANLADQLIAGETSGSEQLAAEAIPVVKDEESAIALLSISDPKGINALLRDQAMPFAETGLTVVYGDNASGKSGYARVVKKVAGARHQDDILPNVFETPETISQSIQISIREAGKVVDKSWPHDSPEILRTIRFYDEACGNDYLVNESEVKFHLSALDLMAGLIGVCGRVGRNIATQIDKNSAKTKTLPAIPAGTKASVFLASIDAKTSDEDIETNCTAPKNADRLHVDAETQVARLKGTNPNDEKLRLSQLAGHINTIVVRVEGLDAKLKSTNVQKLKEAAVLATQLRAAAITASSTKFAKEPVTGVGSDSWRALWEAARAFSEAEAEHEEHFPEVSEGSFCVLCHQELEQPAVDRIKRFEEFVRDQTETKAKAAEQTAAANLDDIEALESVPLSVSKGLVELGKENEQLADDAEKWLHDAESTRSALVQKLSGESVTVPELADSPLALLKAEGAAATANAAEIDDSKFREDFAKAKKIADELEGAIALSKQRAVIEDEVKRRREAAALKNASNAAGTGPISSKMGEFAKRYATAAVTAQFKLESDHLLLRRVDLKSPRTDTGVQLHRPVLSGASGQDIQSVLSEGEQTALGLANYFTEAHFDPGKSPLVLDDPVTSLAGRRRHLVAERLAQFSSDRQVIVFTHEISFVRDLISAAEAQNVPLQEVFVDRKGGEPGLIKTAFPWNAKDVPRRIDHLTTQLAALKKDSPDIEDEELHFRASQWAGDLSEVWEEIVDSQIVGQVINKGTSAVQAGKLKVLVRYSEEDQREFDEGYGFTSKYARRHRNAPEDNVVAPELNRLEQELTRINDWYKKVKGYQRS